MPYYSAIINLLKNNNAISSCARNAQATDSKLYIASQGVLLLKVNAALIRGDADSAAHPPLTKSV